MVTYSASGHARCLATMAHLGMAVLEVSAALSGRSGHRQGLAPPHHGLLVGFYEGRCSNNAQQGGRGSAERIRALVQAAKAKGALVVSAGVEHVALHRPPYRLDGSPDNVNADHRLAAQMLSATT